MFSDHSETQPSKVYRVMEDANNFIGLISAIIGIVALIVSIAIFWYRMSVANSSILKTLEAVVVHLEKTNEFQIEAKRDLEEIHADHKSHLTVCDKNSDDIKEVTNELRSQKEGQKDWQKYITTFFIDLKDQMKNTNDTMNKVNTTLDILGKVIELKMN